MRRLFVAVDLPQGIKEEIAALCRDLPEARWVKMEQFHVTLRFIGSVDELLFSCIRSALSSISAPSFSLHIEGTGFFPPHGIPRTLWVGLNNEPLLLSLYDKIETSLTAVGVAPEERHFSPHITLARFKEVTPKGRITGYLQQHRSFTSSPFTVNEFFLYSSTLTPQGALHSREERYVLVEEQ